MSAANLPEVPEWTAWADPQCAKCGGTGAVGTSFEEYAGWRWCDCAFTNKRRGLPQTDGPIGQET
jgi:hypothetical protein